MTIAAKLTEKGRLEGEKKGKLEGKLEGKIEGEKTLLLRLIERKWGKLRPDIKERLDKINTLEELEALGERVVTSQCVDELFGND